MVCRFNITQNNLETTEHPKKYFLDKKREDIGFNLKLGTNLREHGIPFRRYASCRMPCALKWYKKTDTPAWPAF